MFSLKYKASVQLQAATTTCKACVRVVHFVYDGVVGVCVLRMVVDCLLCTGACGGAAAAACVRHADPALAKQTIASCHLSMLWLPTHTDSHRCTSADAARRGAASHWPEQLFFTASAVLVSLRKYHRYINCYKTYGKVWYGKILT